MYPDTKEKGHWYSDAGMDFMNINDDPEDKEAYRTKQVWVGIDADVNDYFKEVPELPPEPEDEISEITNSDIDEMEDTANAEIE